MSTPRSELEKLDVLLVDDDLDTRELLTEFLEQRGANVVVASSAVAALAAMDVKVPKIILSDIGMPEMNGYDFIRAVRKRAPDKGGGTVAIALTAFATKEDRRHAIDAGFHAHLCKPVELPQLAAVLAALSRQSSGKTPRFAGHARVASGTTAATATATAPTTVLEAGGDAASDELDLN